MKSLIYKGRPHVPMVQGYSKNVFTEKDVEYMKGRHSNLI
jgi:hypothetical protein